MKNYVKKGRPILLPMVAFQLLISGNAFSKNHVQNEREFRSGENNLFNDELTQKTVSDSLLKSVYIFTVSEEVNEEVALKIDLYMKEREGVLDSITDSFTKKITITIQEGYDSQLMLQLIHYAEHLYVVHKECTKR